MVARTALIISRTHRLLIMITLQDRLARTLRKERVKRRWTPTDAAGAYGIAADTYIKLESGRLNATLPSGLGFRLVHFAVLSNHVHLVVEADSKRALSMGMQKLLHSISRRLNALSLKEHGTTLSTKTGSYRALKGWLGRVFADRCHAHLLETPTEMARAVRYVLENAEHHGVRDVGRNPSSSADLFTSAGVAELHLTAEPRGFLLQRACRRHQKPR